MNRPLAAVPSGLLLETMLVATTEVPAAALTNPWAGFVRVASSGVDNPDPVVVEDPYSIFTTDSETRWNYSMTWAPRPDEATSTDPFNTIMPADASGSIFWQQTNTTALTYKIGDGSSNYSCQTVTTVTWSGDAPTGSILPTQIAVAGAELPNGGGWDVSVRATMSFDSGVDTTTVRSGNDNGLDVCNDGTSQTSGPWHDTVTVNLHSSQEPTTLSATTEVTSQSYLQFEPTAVATVNLSRETTPKRLLGATVGGVTMAKSGGAVSVTETARVVDEAGQPVAVTRLCIASKWTFTTKPNAIFQVPYFNEPGEVPGPIAPGGADWEVVDRTVDKAGNLVTHIDVQGPCAYGVSELTDPFHLQASASVFKSWTYQPRVTAVTSGGLYQLDVGKMVKGSVPAKKSISADAQQTVVAP